MGQVGYGVDQAYLYYRRDADELDVNVSILAFITHDFMRMQYDKFMGIPRPTMVLQDGKPVITNTPISKTTYAMPIWLAETLNSADDLSTLKLATKVRDRLNLTPRGAGGMARARSRRGRGGRRRNVREPARLRLCTFACNGSRLFPVRRRAATTQCRARLLDVRRGIQCTEARHSIHQLRVSVPRAASRRGDEPLRRWLPFRRKGPCAGSPRAPRVSAKRPRTAARLQ